MAGGTQVNRPLYFSRIRLKRDVTVKALAPLLLRPGGSRHTGHHLMWSLFTDDAARERDFLWREMPGGVFFVLSARLPEDRHGLFDIAPPKAFEPQLASGDSLGFSLHANPVVRKSAGEKSKKHDVVMEALHGVERGARADRREAAAQASGFAWLERQSARAGFAVERAQVRIDGYEQHRVPRKGGRPMLFSTLDYDGILTVVDPEAFLGAVARGFGSARAYGCGLLLIRRAGRAARREPRVERGARG